MATAQELVEQGIRAYVEGRLDESRRLLEEALQVDPGNSRARSYLLLLPGGLSSGANNRPSRTMTALGGAVPGPRSTPVPFPAARATPLPFVAVTPAPAPEPPPAPIPDPARTPVTTPALAATPPAPEPLLELSVDVPFEITGEHELGQPAPAEVEPLPEPVPMPWPEPPAAPPGPPAPSAPALLEPTPGQVALFEPTPEPPAQLELTPEPPPLFDPTPEPVALAPTPAAPPPAPLRPVEAAIDYAPSPWDAGPASAPSIMLGSEGGLNLDAVAEKSDVRLLVPKAGRPSTPQEDVAVWMTAAKDLLALGDFSGSLEMIEKILKVDPEHAEARDYLSTNESTLVAMYESKLGPLGLVPRLAIKPEEIMWLNLDHRAGFLLSQIDGTVDYENLFALSGLPRLDTARILAGLLADDVITA
jgi:tetratricopeptide (TPR) repeat protein